MSWHLSDAKLATRDEVEKILTRAKASPFDYSFFVTAANTGLRLSEILHLKAKDITRGGLSVIRRKRRELTREVLPIADALAELLASHIRRLKLKNWLWWGDAKACVRVLHRGKASKSQELCAGGHIHKREIQRRWRIYATAAKVYRPGFGVHSLRHYAATEFYRQTKDLRATQILLGHSSSTTTETYAHAVELEAQVKKIRPVL
jgi:integrase